MSKIRGDPRLVALAHDTRIAIVEALQTAEEMSTVLIQKTTDVTRYHLYHHLQQLEKAGIVQNHRDQGLARWWRLTVPIDLSSADPSNGPELCGLPEDIPNLSRRGGDFLGIDIP